MKLVMTQNDLNSDFISYRYTTRFYSKNSVYEKWCSNAKITWSDFKIFEKFVIVVKIYVRFLY